MSEIAILQIEANGLRATIMEAMRGLLERHPDLTLRIEGNGHIEMPDGTRPRGPAYEVVGTSAGGPIVMKLHVDVGLTGR